MHLRKLLALLLFLGAFAPQSVIAATVDHAGSQQSGVITLSGSITHSDVDAFRNAASQYSSASVFLNSEGGLLIPALEIGKIIKAAGFTTVVPKGAICASSCALIWLGGDRRYLSREGKVGFHASYLNHTGQSQESGVANALIGSYLSRAGYSDRAIIFATSAPPEQIVWLSPSNMTQADILFDVWEVDQNTGHAAETRDTSDATRIAEIEQPSRNAGNINTLPSHLPTSLSSGGSRWIPYGSGLYFDASSIEFVRDINGNFAGRRFWALMVYPKDLPDRFPKGLSYSLVLHFVYCPRRTIATERWIDHFQNGRRKREEKFETGGRSSPTEPGTSDQVLVYQVCAYEN